MAKQKVYQETQNEAPILHQEQDQNTSSKNSAVNIQFNYQSLASSNNE